MSIIEKQISLNKVTAAQAKEAREEFKNTVAKLSAKLQQENMKKTKGTSPKILEAGKKEYNLIVKAATEKLPREVVENKKARKSHYIEVLVKARAPRVREQQEAAGLNA